MLQVTILVTGHEGDIGGLVAAHLARGDQAVMGVRTDAKLDSAHRYAGLVVCHGAPGCIKPSVDLTDVEFQKIIDVDLVGTFKICREAGRAMIAHGNGGAIVIVSSIHAIAAYPQRAAYAAAKAGVVGLMRALAVEWARHGVRVNAVLPGQVMATRRTAKLTDAGEYKAMQDRSPSGLLASRLGVLRAIEYLLSAPDVTGHALVVDGGWTASGWYKSHEDA